MVRRTRHPRHRITETSAVFIAGNMKDEMMNGIIQKPTRQDRRPVMNEITAKQKALVAAVNACVEFRAKQPKGIASKEQIYDVFHKTNNATFNGLTKQNRIAA